MKTTKMTAMVILLLLLFAAGGVSSFQSSLLIKDYSGMPCLWDNGLPYFGRFADTNRDVLDLSGTWRFKTDPANKGESSGFHLPDFDHGAWETEPVPGVWNRQDSEHSHYKGQAWYRLSFTPQKNNSGGLYRLYFDGVCFHAKVWLNGDYLGEHSGGYTAWSVDATDALLPGKKNVLAVMVDNRRSYIDVPPRLWKKEKLGWWPYGGIARTARMVRSPAVSINKAVIHAVPQQGGKGRLSVSGLVYNHHSEAREVTVAARLRKGTEVICSELEHIKLSVPAKDCARFDLGEKLIGEIEAWSPSSPSLYTIELEAAGTDAVDKVEEKIGFQRFESKEGELLLNGEPMWFRGMNRHEDDPQTGLYQTGERMDRDMELIKELHVNHMRPGHYPNDPRWLYLCDREGISLTEEIPLYQASSGILKWFEAVFIKGRKNVPPRVGEGYPTLSQMTDPELLDNASQQLIEMIERDRNHASIIMWSVGNENLTYIKSARKMYEHLMGVCKRFDPEREVTFALLCGPGVSPLLEKTGDMPDVLFLNEYYGWYFGEAEGVGSLLDKVHKKYPGKPIVISEFGAGTVAGQHSKEPEKFSEEYQAHVYESQFAQVSKRPWVKGTMPWILADFRCPWFKEEHPVYEMNLKGILNYDRSHKKMAFETIRDFYKEKAASY